MTSSQNTQATPTGDAPGSGSSNPFLAIGLFIRQVIAELRKVVVPTRKELVTYSFTVLLFVTFMILLIFGLDSAFGWLSQIAFTAS
ncbi:MULTISPECIES: preprotein translocase subunit SecE [unclassified Brachybacterium]|uniref:preprotein translocase subunit SecE n=1 Tax=unclassified Brachybacterium TaxID=2623841 RepID=UPI000C805963|nr:preprotein translocase subunit SecE [Brachybacterium sp. UMB0905]PMC76271.1 preprotein translocase subunit SecE [Brachybacterium sp. UMB0905]